MVARLPRDCASASGCGFARITSALAEARSHCSWQMDPRSRVSGTGTHPTTGVYGLEWLDRNLVAGGAKSSIYGCGSGVLGVSQSVQAGRRPSADCFFDIDPQAPSIATAEDKLRKPNEN